MEQVGGDCGGDLYDVTAVKAGGDPVPFGRRVRAHETGVALTRAFWVLGDGQVRIGG